MFPTQAPSEGPFHDLTQHRAESSQGAAAPLPGSQAREGIERGSTLRNTSGPDHRLLMPNGSLKNVQFTVPRVQPSGNQPSVQPSVQSSLPSVEGSRSQVTNGGGGTGQSGNNELLRRSERNVARPVRYSK